MSEQSVKGAVSNWDAAPIIEWLLSEGRQLPDLESVVSQLGELLLDAGMPITRLRLSMRTLHPLTTGVTIVWERESRTVRHMEAPHGLEQRPAFIGSPLEHIARTGLPFRKRLTEPLTEADHEVLHGLKESGGTDYLGLPMHFSVGRDAVLVFTTDADNGFSDADVEHSREVTAVLAPIAEVFGLRAISIAVAEAYLGKRTGKRVLEGQITRGDLETIDAAILVSDIRDWTGINLRLSAKNALALANRYFEIIAGSVESHGGEILKFIGDGVLAIFPTEDDPDSKDGDAAAQACERALMAARKSFNMLEEAKPPLDLKFGIGLHFGEVLYGNIGSRSRIDFTVLGAAVNTAARIEGLCGRLERPILFSQDFAGRLDIAAQFVARETLKGNDSETSVLTI